MEELNSKKSLDIISGVISNTNRKPNLLDANMFLMWGYLTVGVSLLVLVLAYFLQTAMVLWLWFLIPILGNLINFVIVKKSDTKVVTKIDSAISQLWIVIGLNCTIVPFVMFYSGNGSIIPFIEGVLVMIGTVVTGAIIKFKPLYICALIGNVVIIPLAFTNNILYVSGIFALAFIISMIIPAHILKSQISKNV